MVGSGLAYVGMSWCVKKRGPVFTAAFSPLIQILAAMIDIPVLHEQLHLGRSLLFLYFHKTNDNTNIILNNFGLLSSLLGSIVVIIGLYILLWGKKKEMQTCVNKLPQEATDQDHIKLDQEPQLSVIRVTSDS